MNAVRGSARETVASMAAALREAELHRRPIEPLSTAAVQLTLSDAYAIQRHNIQVRLERGRVRAGLKVGLTSRAMQAQLGVNEPDFGVLLDDMVIPDGGAVSLDELIAPRVEGELAFVLAQDLAGPGVTRADAQQALDTVLPAIEVIDSRVRDWRITLLDTVADNASSARVVLGTRQTAVDDVDLRLVGMAFSRDDAVVATGAGAAVLGHPLDCVAWLANMLGQFGDVLRAGDVVLAGALHASIAVEEPGSFTAEFDGLGSVGVRFLPGDRQ